MNSVTSREVVRGRWLAQSWSQLRDFRPQVSVELLALGAALFFTLFCNTAFFREVMATGALHGASGWRTAASLFVLVGALNVLLMALLLNRWTAKPVLIVLLLVTAVAAHFMSQYTIYLDTDMVRNVLRTDPRESSELMSVGVLPSLLVLGVLPSLLVWRLRLRRRTVGKALLMRLVMVGAALLVAILAALASFQSLSALMRNHHEVRHLITPGNYVMSLARVAAQDGVGHRGPRTPLGLQAKVVGRPAHAAPRLLVLVVGETVRAQNWGLNGYERETTPQLARIDPINFRDVTSCGTATEISVPCMFSPWGRENYDKQRVRGSESLMHVLQHAGIFTLWRDNQSGCKGVCEGLPFESFQNATDPRHCDAQGCLDEVMLDGLPEWVARQPGDAVVVLHQLGNHGPTYYKRYPQRMRQFSPTCDTGELGRCSREDIVNSYDNAVLYTDDFLARTIRQLAETSGRDTALIYLSDHGESLGENGLYLHGVPYAIAPQTQTRVPMVMWLSPGFARSRGVDLACMRREGEQTAASQDNLFHSVLGLMQVSTPEYDARQDLFRACTPNTAG